MSENDGNEEGGNSPIKLVILVVVLLVLGVAGWYSVNKSKSLRAEGLPPAKPVDPNAPKREIKMPDLSGDKITKILMNSKKKGGAAAAEATPAAAAPVEATPAEGAAAPAPGN